MIVSVARDGAEIGEYPREELDEMARRGQLQPTDLCWFEGMENWLLLEDFLGPKVWKTTEPVAARRRVPIAPRSVKAVKVRSLDRRTRAMAVPPVPKFANREPRLEQAEPGSPWIFIATVICVAAIWGAAFAFKTLHPPSPNKLPLLSPNAQAP